MNQQNAEKGNWVPVQVELVPGPDQPATWASAVEWGTSDPNIATIAVDPQDSSKAHCICHANGTVQVTAKGSVSVGGETRPFAVEGTLVVSSEVSETGEVSFRVSLVWGEPFIPATEAPKVPPA